MRHHKFNNDELGWYILLSKIRIRSGLAERSDPDQNRTGSATLDVSCSYCWYEIVEHIVIFLVARSLPFDFQHYVMICKLYKTKNLVADGSSPEAEQQVRLVHTQACTGTTYSFWRLFLSSRV